MQLVIRIRRTISKLRSSTEAGGIVLICRWRDGVKTGSGPGSPRGQPAWGGGCDRVATDSKNRVCQDVTRLLPRPNVIQNNGRTRLIHLHTASFFGISTPTDGRGYFISALRAS